MSSRALISSAFASMVALLPWLVRAEVWWDLSREVAGGLTFEVQAVLLPILVGPPDLAGMNPMAGDGVDAQSRFDALRTLPGAVAYRSVQVTVDSHQLRRFELQPEPDRHRSAPSFTGQIVARNDFQRRFYAIALARGKSTGSNALDLADLDYLVSGTLVHTGWQGKQTVHALPMNPALGFTLHLLVTAVLPDHELILPRLALDRVTLPEALETLRELVHQHHPKAGGLNLVLDNWVPDLQSIAPSSLSLDLDTIPLRDALRYLADLAGHRLIIEPQAVIFTPLVHSTPELYRREFKVGEKVASLLDSVHPRSWLAASGALSTPFSEGYQVEWMAFERRLTIRERRESIARTELLFRLLGADTAPPLPEVWKRANALRLAEVRLHDLILPEAVAELNTLVVSAGGAGRFPPFQLESDLLNRPQQSRINLQLHDVALSDVLRYLALQARLRLVAVGDSLVFRSYFSR